MNDDDPTRDARGRSSSSPFGPGRRPNASDGLEKLFDAFGGSRTNDRFERIMRDVASWFDGEDDGHGKRGGTVHEADTSGRDASGARSRDDARTGPVDDAGRDGARPGPAVRAHDDYADESGDASGSFRGRGPRNYRRTDERITELVNDALRDDDAIDASDIEVSVADGDVTLSGTVPLRRLKHRAENVAVRASGAHDVDNRLRVKRDAASEPSSTSPGGTPGEARRDADDYGHPA